jgi:hypothetical protein
VNTIFDCLGQLVRDGLFRGYEQCSTAVFVGDPVGDYGFSENWVEVRDGTLPRDR